MSYNKDNNNIIWLASYPKSGNTWFRVFLTNLLKEENQAIDINNLYGGQIASSRSMFEDAVGIEASDLSFDEIDLLRPEVYNYISNQATSVLFHKIHDAFVSLSNGKQLIPESASKGAIYFIRNPLDVAVSFAHHSAISFEKTAENMADNNYSFCSKPEKLHNQLRQKLLTWSNHVKSWTEQSTFPVHIVQYEDMKTNTLETFTKAINFCNLPIDENKIKLAIKKSDINLLQKQESELGFKEKPANMERFFRKGIIGSWKEELPQQVIEKIRNDHKEIMIKFGYWE